MKLLPRILEVFSERHPNVPVSVRDLLLGRLDELLRGEVDVAFTRLLPGQAALELEVIGREPRVVALRADHRLAGRERLAFADLRGERFITNPLLESDGPPARWLAEQARHGLAGDEAAQAASIQEILTLVASRRGVSLVPASVAGHFPRRDVRYVEVVDADPAVTSLAWPRGDLRPAVRAFIAAARDVASTHTHLV
jgi:DNA-binding transcriptional LysR family regulator